jgi:E3 ubiquitin-protein ligase HECTD2
MNESNVRLYTERTKTSHHTLLPKLPCSHSVIPILDPPSGRGETPQHMDRRDSLPYSRSSPDDLFSARLEQRNRELNTVRSGDRIVSCVTRREFHQVEEHGERSCATTSRHLFKSLEDYIITSFGAIENLNSSFSTVRPKLAPRAASEGAKRLLQHPPLERNSRTTQMSELDAKTLLLGDFAENGSWWTGSRSEMRSPERSRTHRRGGDGSRDNLDLVTLKSPCIDWSEAHEWYDAIVNAGRSWRKRLNDLSATEACIPRLRFPSEQELDEIDEEVLEAQNHTQRVLLKATETLLKRPGRQLNDPSDLRFLLLILANPLLYPSSASTRCSERKASPSRQHDTSFETQNIPSFVPLKNFGKGSSGQHSGIIKRVLGLLSNVPNECHHHLVVWFAKYPDIQFRLTTDLIGSFVTYRLTKQHGRKRDIEQDSTSNLIPNMSGSGRNNSAALHAALGSSSQSRKVNSKPNAVIYNDDWQIKAAARVMALLFSANNNSSSKRGDARNANGLEQKHSAGLAAREKAYRHGQILPISDFYNTLLDYSDLIADFEAWESKRAKFSFCQYPFFLSIWAKIQIMEHDARRQMEVKAREAFFDSIMTRKNVNQYLFLKVRRECLVEDSLRGVSEVVGTGGEEIKKGLRIEFKGEEGIDAGGLRKEWFLLLVRDVFNPEHGQSHLTLPPTPSNQEVGMFTYDEDSHLCFFNANSFETTDQFFLVGVVLGLAIYNSTILDVALPPFAFRKLLAAGPATVPGATSHAKPLMSYSLDDLAEYRPALASGLRQLLEFDGDVETTFCRDFVADVERYGQVVQVPLCPDGEKRPVTNTNRREFVDLYVRYLLDTAVTRQFEPFKRGFFTVCGGNALSLFRPEEIELLIRGSDEPLDIASLRVVSTCENWGVPNPAETEPVVRWFWESFQSAKPTDQRKLLSFITGSDRIPAMGATNLVIKISCLGEDSMRFPVARTCFNMLSLWRYSSQEKLSRMLWRAVHESEGFGLK